MKNVIMCFIAAIIVFAANGCDSCSRETKTKTVKIGVLQSLTGEGAYWGKNGQNGIQLAFDEIQKKQTKYDYELIWEDSETDASKAVSAFNKLVGVDNVKYCIVDVISSDVLAIAPIANQKKVIIISPGASNPKITDAGDYVFRNWPSDALQGKEQARVTEDILNWKTVAILKVNNDYGNGLASVYAENLKRTKIVANESYEKGSINFKTQFQKIKEVNPDGIYLLAYPEEMPAILKQAKELNLDKHFLGTETFESYELIEKVGDLANGLIYTFPKSPDSSVSVVKDFRNNYLERYNKPFGTPADVAYDALFLLVNAIEKNGDSVENIKSALYNVKNYQGASGFYSIDNNGDAIKPFELRIIYKQKFTPYEKVL